jgi:hypothetical protein
MLSRDFAAAPGHFITTYCRTNSSQVAVSFGAIIDSGKPDSMSNASPRLMACIRSDRKLSASARVANVRDFGSVPTSHRVVYDFLRLASVLTWIFRTRTSRDFMTTPPGVAPATPRTRYATPAARHWGA